PQGKAQLWFLRDGENTEKSFTFSRKMTGENRAIEALTRKNSLFLSAAAQNNHEFLTPIYNWITESVQFFVFPRSVVQPQTIEFCGDERHQSQISGYLVNADIGVKGVQIVDR